MDEVKISLALPQPQLPQGVEGHVFIATILEYLKLAHALAQMRFWQFQHYHYL